MTAWCRACGVSQAAQSGSCSACSVDLSINQPDETAIGLVFEVRGKLGVGKKQGVCLSVEGDTYLLHFSPKDKEPGRVPSSTAPAAVVPATLGPASRLLFAAGLQEGKQSWDREALRKRAAELCSDVRVLRRLADDALILGWQHILEWAPLTDGEKSWRTAHHAAATGDLDALREAVVKLPSTGYPNRASLLLPHLGAIHHQPEAWKPALDTIAQSGATNAEAVKSAAIGSWSDALGSAGELAAANRRTTWAKLKEQLEAGTTLSPPPFHDTPAWSAASLVSSADRSRPIDSALEQLVGLEPALWDDLVDEGRVTKSAALTSLRGGLKTYLLARLDPAKLSDADAKSIGHVGEFARRLFLTRDKATLSGLERTPRVEHYQALLDVIDGGRPDARRLDADTIRLLELPTTVLGQIKDGATSTLPPEVVADPSLWPMFADVAISGKLVPDASRTASDPLNLWIGAHRLLGLIWEGNLTAAVEHGKLLAPHAKAVEEQEDEILNLTAYALYQLGRVDEALGLLEDALQGLYTENLLVNTSIVAGKARPEVGVKYLARLVSEAPTPDLQRAGLDHAISVWERTDLAFPQVLVPALRTVLGADQPVDEYLRLGRVAVGVAPEIIGSLANPGGELDGPYRLIQIRGRWKTDKDMFLSHLAEQYIALYRSVGRADWFMDDWSTWIDTIRESVFTDFGEAAGSAEFIDKVLVDAPDLFKDEERFLLAPQAGAHLNTVYANQGNWLNDQALRKFFFSPIEDFHRTRSNFNDSFAEYLATNFTLCIGNVGIRMVGAGRDSVAESYNPLVERLRWDTQNRFTIITQMDRILGETEQGILATLRTIVEQMRRLGSEEKRDLTRMLTNDVEEWQDEINRLRRNL